VLGLLVGDAIEMTCNTEIYNHMSTGYQRIMVLEKS